MRKNIPNSFLIITSFLLALMTIMPNLVLAQQEISGKYKSLDGKFKHNFMSSGDYFGEVKTKKVLKTGAGLFRSAKGICWLPSTDGTKGDLGNVIIYVGETQCCLNFSKISDKYAVSKIWVDNAEELGFYICNNQVLVKEDKQ